MMSAVSNSEKLVSYQKKDGRAWYDNDKDFKVCFLVTHLMHSKDASLDVMAHDTIRFACKWKKSAVRN